VPAGGRAGSGSAQGGLFHEVERPVIKGDLLHFMLLSRQLAYTKSGGETDQLLQGVAASDPSQAQLGSVSMWNRRDARILSEIDGSKS